MFHGDHRTFDCTTVPDKKLYLDMLIHISEQHTTLYSNRQRTFIQINHTNEKLFSDTVVSTERFKIEHRVICGLKNQFILKLKPVMLSNRKCRMKVLKNSILKHLHQVALIQKFCNITT